MDIPTDLPRTQDPPEHDTQLPAATSPTAEPPQTPDEVARDILAEDGPSTRRAAIRAYKYLHAMVRQHGPQLQKVYEASKEHATRSKGIQESLKYRTQPQELPAVPPRELQPGTGRILYLDFVSPFEWMQTDIDAACHTVSDTWRSLVLKKGPRDPT